MKARDDDIVLSDEEQELAQAAMGPRRTAQIHDEAEAMIEDNDALIQSLMSAQPRKRGKVYKDGKLIVAQRKSKRQAQRAARKAQR